MAEARLLRVRELRAALEAVRAENARLRAENDMFSAHFDLALVAAEDLRTLGPDGKIVLVDGWNQVLGANRTAHSPEELLAQARAHAAARPQDLVWIVYDGSRPGVTQEGRVRVSYTGGTGAHRADRFICDFLRMAKFRGDLAKVEVKTDDRDFRRAVERIRA